MTYISFDEFSKDALHKEREACFLAGTNGEKLAQYITDNKDKHSKHVNALRITVGLFAEGELKSRPRGKVVDRLEQERKWVTHFEGCAAEHKKGTQVHKLKVELEKTKSEFTKKTAAIRAAHENRIEEIRKQCRIEYFAEFEAAAKVKKQTAANEAKEAKKNKKSWFGKFWDWFTGTKPEAKPKPKPSAMAARQAVPVNAKASSPTLYMHDPEARKKRIEELRAKQAERNAAKV